MAESFGKYLRRERELREIPLEEISRQTKIALRTLTALEADRFAELPARPFLRGFVRAYAEAIGLDPKDAVLRLDHLLMAGPAEKPAAVPVPPAPAKIPTRLLFLFFAFLVVAAFFLGSATVIAG